jgi:protein-L-isoaspartate(D-aspartate) O-methyltransferase
MSTEDFEVLRQHMLAEISAGTFHVSGLIGKAALDERVMMAMGKVPRHEFVPIELQLYAYANIPIPIGFDKTISQPFIVALMTDLLDIGAEDTVLEIGTGLGYQAAILAQLARKVYSIEIIEELGRQAKQRFRRQGYTNIEGQDRQWLSWLVRARPL